MKEIEVFVPVVARSRQGKGTKKRFHDEVRLNHLPEKKWNELPTDDFSCVIEFHFTHRATGDIDNLLKPTLDVVKMSLIQDDCQIKEIHAYIKEYSSRAGFKVILTPLKKVEVLSIERPAWGEVPKEGWTNPSRMEVKRKLKGIKLEKTKKPKNQSEEMRLREENFFKTMSKILGREVG